MTCCIFKRPDGLLDLFFSVPTIGADFFTVDADGFQQTVKGLVSEGVKAHFLADGAEQTFTSFRGSVCIFIQMGLSLIAFQFLDRCV